MRKRETYTCKQCNNIFYRRKDTHKRSLETHNDIFCNTCIKKKNYEKNTAFIEVREKAIELASIARSEKGISKQVTIYCGYCNKEFVVPYGERNRLYCGKSCQSKSIFRAKTALNKSECQECKKEFTHYGSRILCSVECNAKYLSKARIGENNPAWKDDNESTICLNCNEKFTYNRDGLQKERERKYCSLSCARKQTIKQIHSKSEKSIYPFGYRKKFKEIRNRFNNCCALCGNMPTNEKLSVHHINYIKTDMSDNNLIPLCRRCHSKTNSRDRYFWQTLFRLVLSSSRIVKKKWGFEIHICNHADYCLKYLVFFKKTYFSNHYHVSKKELWHCLVGNFEVVLTDLGGEENAIVEWFGSISSFFASANVGKTTTESKNIPIFSIRLLFISHDRILIF
jgi:hypothetical protein